MKIFNNKVKLKKEILSKKNLFFVPTMGALHSGHINLIKKAKKKDSKVIVSIFVNPRQFNNKIDFKGYPKNINRDLNLLRKLKIDYLYKPTYDDIYSFKTKNKIYLDKFNNKLCGKLRKNHFKGVIDVVNRLLEIIKPQKILLGLKDFQQVILIKKNIKKRKIKTKIISCKTIRENNGIPCSSRNEKLNFNQHKIASDVFKLLKKEKKLLKKKSHKFNEFNLKKKIISLGVQKIDYVKCLDLKKIIYTKNFNIKFNIFIAYYINNVRLIDNI